MKFEEDFEKGGDPFAVLVNGNHINSVAGVLKTYFRKLRPELISEAYFDQFMNITSMDIELLTLLNYSTSSRKPPSPTCDVSKGKDWERYRIRNKEQGTQNI